MSGEGKPNFDLSADRRALLASLLRQQGIAASGNEPELAPRVNQADAPLSFAQERLCFLDQFMPGLPVYNIPIGVRLVGPLDLEILRQSLRTIVSRHEVLRATFTTHHGRPVQTIASDLQLALPVTPLTQMPEAERAAEATRQATELAAAPFDLAQGPLIRAAVWKLGAEDHLLLLAMHHIISEGASFAIIFRELTQIYPALLSGQEPQLPSLPVQFPDYAAWQRERLEGSKTADELKYWKSQLANVPASLELPLDHPRPGTQTFHGQCVSRILSPELVERLRRLAREENATLYMLLVAALATLLARYSGQTDLTIGSPVTGRNHAKLAGLIGFFVNTVVLRIGLSGAASFRELIRRTRDTVLEAFGHQEVPFELVVDAVKPARQLDRNPLYQVLFTLQDTSGDDSWRRDLRLPGISAEPFSIRTPSAKVDLTLDVDITADGMVTLLEYNTSLFEESTVSRLLTNFAVLLESIVAFPEKPWRRLPLLGPEERTFLLEACNPDSLPADPASLPSDTSIAERFRQQAVRTPNAVALTFNDQLLSYRELNEHSDRLAQELLARGVGPDTLVAMYLERGLELVVAILGILKAGGAYVPLDPASPPERLAFMLSDTQAPVLITQSNLATSLAPSSALLLFMDTFLRGEAAIERETEAIPFPNISGSNLAYVIYTSGSTGKPKGVPVTQTNVIRLFDATNDWFHFGPEDVWTLFHSCAFDFSVWELWGALLYGGRLVVVPRDVARSADAFYELLGSEQVTILNQTPSAFRQLIQAEAAVGVHPQLALREIIFGGEALDLASLRPWFERHGDQQPRLVNMYGITETTVHVTYRPITWQDVEAGLGSVIGVPIPDLQVFLLDEFQQPVPIGVPGEIYVGGQGVAVGYLNRPELTAERFPPNPFAPEGAASAQNRLYRSGDVARRLASGELEYLGRADDQVKIRGFRIEPGEIEAVLAEDTRISAVRVVLREDTPGEKRLVAYYTSGEGELSTTDLRNSLRARLPEYMIPAAFVLLNQIPLTNNGKLDRRALPAPATERPNLDQRYLAPRTAEEHALAEVWQQTLKVDQVGIEDNFFDVGGNSLLSLEVVARIRERLKIELSVVKLFQFPTIAALAKHLQEAAAVPTIKSSSAAQDRAARQKAALARQRPPARPR